MGHWGYNPSECDAAQDLVLRANEALVPHLHELFAQQCEADDWLIWNRLGLVQELLQRGFFVPRDVYLRCIEDLRQRKAARAWLIQWRYPDRAKRTLERLLKALLALDRYARMSQKQQAMAILSGERPPKRILPWPGWPKPQRPKRRRRKR